MHSLLTFLNCGLCVPSGDHFPDSVHDIDHIEVAGVCCTGITLAVVHGKRVITCTIPGYLPPEEAADSSKLFYFDVIIQTNTAGLGTCAPRFCFVRDAGVVLFLVDSTFLWLTFKL